MLTLTLDSRPNPDFYETRKPAPRRSVKIETVFDASTVCRDYIDAYRLGVGNWAGGLVTDETGNAVARVSYNGRVWKPGPYPTPEIKPN